METDKQERSCGNCSCNITHCFILDTNHLIDIESGCVHWKPMPNPAGTKEVSFAKQLCIHITEMGWHDTDDYDERIIDTILNGFEEHYRKKIRAEVCEEFFKVMRSQICYCGDGWCDKPSCETMEDRLKYMEKVKKEISKAREGKDGK